VGSIEAVGEVMAFHHLDVPQGSAEWLAVRLGKLTGSHAADMLTTIKTGEAAARRNLRVRLVLERIIGKSQARDFVKSQAMQDGAAREPEARALYEALTGQLVTETGFLQHDTLLAGCSLDGHLGDFDGIIEIKSPIAATHLEYLRTGLVPRDYLGQVVHNLWITGALWCDWLSYQPDFPERLQVKLVRVARDEAAIHDYETKALAFLAEVEAETARVAEMAAA
jgi:hypothetical protein